MLIERRKHVRFTYHSTMTTNKEEKMAHTCKNCGAIADDPGHLCDPTTEELSCDYCGTKDVGVNHVCKQKLASMKYSCNSCGKMAPEEDRLCNPVEIK